MPIVKIITLLFLKVKAGEAFGHHSRKEKRISAGAVLPPSKAGAAGRLSSRRGWGCWLIHTKKRRIFLTVPGNQNYAALSSLSDEHSRPTAAVRGVLAALAEFRQTGTVRNTPFLRPDPKKHHSRPAQGKPAAGRHQNEARPRYLFPSFSDLPQNP